MPKSRNTLKGQRERVISKQELLPRRSPDKTLRGAGMLVDLEKVRFFCEMVLMNRILSLPRWHRSLHFPCNCLCSLCGSSLDGDKETLVQTSRTILKGCSFCLSRTMVSIQPVSQFQLAISWSYSTTRTRLYLGTWSPWLCLAIHHACRVTYNGISC